MRTASSLLCVLSFTAIAYGYSESHRQLRRAATNYARSTCNKIAGTISGASGVYFPDNQPPHYVSDVAHYFTSSSQDSTCSVEPGSAEDVSKILGVLANTRTPFAIKSGGCATNQGFSSTKSVQISMTRFNEIKVNTAAGTVELGAGLTSDQVYKTLEPYNITVMASRGPGVGIAGTTLGGGYGWKSDQYGLAIDNVVGYELVLPDGTIKSVTSKDTDLWFGLRGGLNNFGIVTKFIVKSFPQGSVWGGYVIYPHSQLGAVKDAVMKYQEKKYHKASATFTLRYSTENPDITVIAFLFYDKSSPPRGLFDDFLAIPSTQKDLSSRSYLDLVMSLDYFKPTKGFSDRGRFSGLSVTQYSPTIFDACVNVTKMWGDRLHHFNRPLIIDTVLQQVASTIFTHGSDSAYPPERTRPLFPILVQYMWTDAAMDDTVGRLMRKHTTSIQRVAIAEGQNVANASVYVNNALFDTPLEDIYGANLPMLRKIRAEIDPQDVMGLTGGFKF